MDHKYSEGPPFGKDLFNCFGGESPKSLQFDAFESPKYSVGENPFDILSPPRQQ